MKMETVEIQRTKVLHQEYKIEKIFVDELDIQEYIKKLNIRVQYDPYFPSDSKVIFPEEFEQKFWEILDGIYTVYENRNKLLGALAATHVFEIFEKFYALDISNGKHLVISKISEAIVKLTLDWEAFYGNRKKIHKGALYGFMCRLYLLLGNDYSAFSFLYSSYEEDLRLGKECHEINYPETAPSFLTITLTDDYRNFLHNYVKEIRKYISKEIKFYNHFRFKVAKNGLLTSKNLTIQEFDEKFLKNKKFINIVFFFVFTVWIIFNYKRNVSKEVMINEFSYLKNPDLLFSLCLIINQILNIINGSNEDMVVAVREYLTHKGFLTRSEFELDNTVIFLMGILI